MGQLELVEEFRLVFVRPLLLAIVEVEQEE